MHIISAKLSGDAKVKTKPPRTEGLSKNSGQGQSVDRETALQNIIDPRVRTISKIDEKVRRYPLETVGSEIKNSLQHLSGPYTLRCQNT